MCEEESDSEGHVALVACRICGGGGLVFRDVMDM
jgi:hypothetical protein